MRKIISLVVAILLTALSLCGCGSTSNKIVGAWQAVDDGSVMIFTEDGQVQYFEYDVFSWDEEYSLQGNKLELSRNGYSQTFDVEFPEKNVMHVKESEQGEVIVLERFATSSKKANSLVNTWVPVGDLVIDSVHIGSSSVPEVSEITFYKDRSFQIVYGQGYHSTGEYELIFDGEVLRVTGQSSRAEWNYEFLEYGMLKIEYSIYGGEMHLTHILRPA